MKNKYDVVIIGSGIGGLVCGCYLAKAGMDVLILEQHNKAGGYCTSFKRKNFTFDAGVHQITGCSEEGVLGKIINELDSAKILNIKRFPNSEIVKTKDYEITLHADHRLTMEQLNRCFPAEQDNIQRFFELFHKSILFDLYGKLHKSSFKEFIDGYFRDERLKSFWYIICCEMGISPSKLPAIAGFTFCRAFIMDGGYYPAEGGMQALSDGFLSIFKRFGGTINFSDRAQKIHIKSGSISGVSTQKNPYVKTKHLVVNCDPVQTYSQLIEPQYVPDKYLRTLLQKKTSPSFFVVFLGLKSSLKSILPKCSAIFFSPEYLSDREYDVFENFDLSSRHLGVVPSSFLDPTLAPEDGESIFLFKIVPFFNKAYWEQNKYLLAERTIHNAEMIVPDLSSNIAHTEIATPYTFYKYTGNLNGASRGWLSDHSNTGLKIREESPLIAGLYFASHWSPSPVGNGGIAMAAYAGQRAARQVSNSLR